jgi:hypothetical protein
MHRSFRSSMFHMRYTLMHVGSELSLFGQPLSDQESVLMTRCLVRIQPKFRQHNPDVLRCTISGVHLENNRVMLSKFHLDLSLTSRHKHALLITLEWVYDLSFHINVVPRHEE